MSGLVLSLFPGIGLLDMAFEEEGFCVVRGPDLLWGGDARAFRPPAGRFDGVIGGPPCQSFSALANLVRARGYEPRFGNLIPEFERVVTEARPAWFLMENVPAAPVPAILHYGTHSFVIDNCALDGGDGWGLEQERKRRITFGLADGRKVDLRRWISPAALLLPAAARSSAVLGDLQETPVALGGSGKLKRMRQHAVSTIDNASLQSDGPNYYNRVHTRTVTKLGGEHLAGLAASTQRVRSGAVGAAHQGVGPGRRRVVTGNVGGIRTGTVSSSDGSPVGMAPMRRYRLAEACRLQGLSDEWTEAFIKHAPFKADAKLRAVANGVPIQLGRALARAIKEALGLP